jgi:hypothetical protein
MSLNEDGDYYRARAKDARAMAVMVVDPNNKRLLLAIAEEYEELAKRADDRAASHDH